MKAKSLFIVVFLSFCFSVFSQGESTKERMFQDNLPTFYPESFLKKAAVAKEDVALFYLNTKKWTVKVNQPENLLKAPAIVYDYSAILQKISDYKFNAYSCSGNYISSKDLITEMILDDLTNGIVHKLFK